MNANPRGQTLLQAESISLTLEGTPILRDLSVTIKDLTRPGVTTGQIVGFLGPSGMGKTMLFEILAGLRKPTTGQVTVGVDQHPVQAGEMGVVQQSYPLFYHRTVEDNLLIVTPGNTLSEKKDKVNAMLHRFGLLGQAGLYPAQLSGGQRQRVAIMQQILPPRDFVLLDEPFSGLDILMIREVSEAIQEVANQDDHNTVIIISHDIVSTAAIADTIWLLGRDRDQQGLPIPGARVKHTYDLVERDLCWQPEIYKLPSFQGLLNEIRDRFQTL